LSLLLPAQKDLSRLSEVQSAQSSEEKLKLINSYSGKKLSKFLADKFRGILDSIEPGMKGAGDKALLMLTRAKLFVSAKDYVSALPKYFDALKIFESLKDSLGQAKTHLGIGTAYFNTDNDVAATRHFYSAIAFAVSAGGKKTCIDAESMLGTIFKNQKKLDSSLFHLHHGERLSIETGDSVSLAGVLNDIGLAYKNHNEHEKALSFLLQALDIRERIHDQRGIAGANINIGNTLRRLDRYKDAMPYYNKGIEVSAKSGDYDFYLNGIMGRARNLVKLGEYKEAASEMSRYVESKDSLTKVELTKTLAELDVNYQSEKKDADLLLHKAQLKAKTSENLRQRILIIASVIALLLAMVAIFFIYRSFHLNRKNAQDLASKNAVIEEKNRQITDSINYAKIIQHSLLPEKDFFDHHLGEYFILFRPKDIVSGDFYWGARGSAGFLVACVDCTGHGVPGAFMSLIGKENLDKALVKTEKPGNILFELNKGVKKSLGQDRAEASRDGMDAAVIKIERLPGEKIKVNYSGANRSLLLVKKAGNNIEEIKPTKHAIGGFTSNEQVYENHELMLNAGDMIYLSTDGYADQFGESNKKLTTKKFREILLGINHFSAREQKQRLEDFLVDWKGNVEQLDDILVIGIRL
jgi:serine phosphatase RsbU (regulator of sigma subunit)